MKRNLFIAIFLCSAFLSTGQTKISFFDFVESFDWGISQSEFEDKYQTMIVEKSDTAEMQYVMSDMYIDQYPFNVLISFSHMSKQGHGLLGLAYKDSVVTLIAYPQNDSIEAMPISSLNLEFEKKFGPPKFSVDDKEFDFSVLPQGNIRKYDNASLWQIDKPTIITNVDTNSQSIDNYIILVSDLFKGNFSDLIKRPDSDFHNFNWGASKLEVIASERKEDILGLPDKYAVFDLIGGRFACVLYEFVNDKLYAGSYGFFDLNDYYKEYEYFFDLLSKKYGTPLFSECKKLKDNIPTHLSKDKLVKRGYVEYSSSWMNLSSLIFLSLKKNDKDIYLLISYISKDYSEKSENSILELL